MGKAKAAKTEESEKITKRHKHVDRGLLKVSKSIKIQAAFASLRGHSFRTTIRLLGEAEDAFKKNGRLILGGTAE